MKKKINNGTLEDFPTGTLFEIGMLEGCAAGLIHAAGDSSNYFYGVEQPIYFKAAETIEGGSDTVKILVGLIEQQQSGMQKVGEGEKEMQPEVKSNYLKSPPGGVPANPLGFACFNGNFESPINVPAKVVVQDESIEILLGETKYFAVKKKEENGVVEKIEIVEIPVDYGVEPDFPTSAGEGWQWIKQSDIWPAEPVEKVEGDKFGVYWEKEKPVWNRNSKGNDLKKGIIRLVGKYWEVSKTFEVELKAKLDEKTTSTKIVVKKPNKLLLKDTDPSFRWSKDIRDNDLDIDSYLIEIGGKYGIPPQLLKGQLFEEAYHKENESFWPSYRYEPWSDLRFRRGKYKEAYKEQPYWVNDSGMGVENGGEPVQIDHQNVRPILNFSTPTPYPNNPMEIGIYVADNLEEYYAGKHLNRKFNGPPMYGPSKLQETWDFLVQYYSTHGNGDPEFQADYFIRIYLKQTYKDFAQTRKAASYGYFQMLYTTAILKEPKGPNYPRWPGNYPAPEKLNDQGISTPYVMNHLKNNIIMVLKNTSKTFDKNDWTNGFEQAWFDSYHLYNERSDYDDNVFIFSKKFLPR